MSNRNSETITILPPADAPAATTPRRIKSAGQQSAATPQPVAVTLPFRLPGIVRAGGFMVLGAAAFFAYEALVPTQLKPSYNLGSYDAAIIEAQKQG